MTENRTYNDSPTFIPARLESAVHGLNPVADAKDIYDIEHQKWQKEINQEVEEQGEHLAQIDESLNGKYDKNETYSKTEVDAKESNLQGQINTIKGGSTKSIATLDNEINGTGGIDQRLEVVEELGTISVGGGDIGIATEEDFGSDTPTDLAKVPTVGAIHGGLGDGVYDISARNEGAAFDSLEDLLNDDDLATIIPTHIRKGGMTIRFIQSSDNKYVQYRLMADSFSTTESDWQGVDDEPTLESKNLVKSGGVYPIKEKTDANTESLSDLGYRNLRFHFDDGGSHGQYARRTQDISLKSGTTYLFKVSSADTTTWTQIILIDANNNETPINLGVGNREFSYTMTFDAVKCALSLRAESLANYSLMIINEYKDLLINTIPSIREMSQDNKSMLSEQGYNKIHFHFDDGGFYGQYARRTQNIGLKAGTKYQFDINSVDTTTKTQIMLIDSSDNEYTINEGTGNRTVEYTPTVNIVKCAISLRVNGQPVDYSLEIVNVLVKDLPALAKTVDEINEIIGEINNVFDFSSTPHSQFSNRNVPYQFVKGHSYNLYVSSTDSTTPTYFSLRSSDGTELQSIGEIDAGNRVVQFVCTVDGAERLYMSLYTETTSLFNVLIEDKTNIQIDRVKIGNEFGFKSVNHRGFNAVAPENTLPAYILSKKMGYKYVECDITVTSDGVPVLLHDETIDRTSDGTGTISEMTFAQVRMYDFGSWKSAIYAGTKIPSIWEFLQLCKHLGLKPYIEFWGALTQSIIEKIFDYIDALGMLNDITIISFSGGILNIVKTVNPNVRLGLNVSSINAENVAFAQSLKLSTNEVFVNTGDISNSDLLNNLDIGLETWTVNTFARVNDALMNVRCSGITSDYYQAEPIILQKYSLI